MKNARLKFHLFLVILAVLFFTLLYRTCVLHISVPVATIEGSYADQFADEHGLESLSLADTQEIYFDLRYETFEYNIENGGLTLTAYNGQSSTLVIPTEINGISVLALDEAFWETLGTVTDLYPAPAMKSVEGTIPDTVTLHLQEDSALYQQMESEGNVQISVYPDSEYINFDLGDIPFEYNISDQEIELVSYIGDEDLVIIPSYINGMPVTKVAIDFLGEVSGVVIPETVTEITGALAKTIYNKVLVVESVFTLIAFIVTLIMVNVVLTRLTDSEEFFLSAPQAKISFGYLAFQIVFTILTVYQILPLAAIPCAVVSAIALLICMAGVGKAQTGRKLSKSVRKKTAEKTNWMKAFQDSCQGMDSGIADPEVKKQVARLIEDIRFSDPVSNEQTIPLEQKLAEEVEQLRTWISDGDDQNTLVMCTKLRATLGERNKVCKRTK